MVKFFIRKEMKIKKKKNTGGKSNFNKVNKRRIYNAKIIINEIRKRTGRWMEKQIKSKLLRKFQKSKNTKTKN